MLENLSAPLGLSYHQRRYISRLHRAVARRQARYPFGIPFQLVYFHVGPEQPVVFFIGCQTVSSAVEIAFAHGRFIG